MVSNFYNENAPMPFAGMDEKEEEPLVSGQNHRRMLFPGGVLGPLGYMGQVYPFMMGPSPDPFGYEEEDPNP